MAIVAVDGVDTEGPGSVQVLVVTAGRRGSAVARLAVGLDGVTPGVAAAVAVRCAASAVVVALIGTAGALDRGIGVAAVGEGAAARNSEGAA